MTTPATHGPRPPPVAAPPPAGARAPSRRRFLGGSLALGWFGVVGGFGASSLAFLWPDLRGGFGAVLDAGPQDEILAAIARDGRPLEFGPGRSYLVAYDPADDPDRLYADLTRGAGVMAVFWTCVHLGCKVPFCASSQWLECGCHGSAYNRWGELQNGPAPRGLDRFPVELADGHVMVDTRQVVTGPSPGAGALDEGRAGPSCLQR